MSVYINQLPLASGLVAGDQFIVWATNQGDSRRTSGGDVKSFVNASPAWTGVPTYEGLNVTLGANDSGGPGFRALIVPNS